MREEEKHQNAKNKDKIPNMLRDVREENGKNEAINGNRGLQLAATESSDNNISSTAPVRK